MNDVAIANISLISVTFEVSQLSKFWLNDDALENIKLILVTLEVSQKLISKLKELSLKKLICDSTLPDISVTKVVHRLTLPLAISPAIVELSTTV